MVVFTFTCLRCYLLSSVAHWLFSSILFSLHICEFCSFFPSFPLQLISSYLPLWKDIWYYFSLLKFIESFFVVKHVIYPRECSIFTWKVFSVAFTGICYKCLLSSSDIMSFKAYHALLIFSLIDLSKDVIRVLKSGNVIALWSISPIIL